MGNEAVIHKFYTAFARHDAQGMAQCYHPGIVFKDPVFGELQGKQVSDMWKMLLEKSGGKLKIVFSDLTATESKGSAKWVAYYKFSKTNRDVTNHITAAFEFKDGLIFRHTDSFSVWKWASQAFGTKGFLLGWTSFFRKKLQEQSRTMLEKYRL